MIFSSFARRAALSAAFMLATAASVSASELKEVKIGVLTDMAGPYSDAIGPGSVLAAQMAVADFIAAEKPGFTASVLSADHGNKPDVATNLARAWFERDNVDMLVDLTNSAVALAGGKIATQYDKVAIVTGAGGTILFNEECSPNVAIWTFSTYALAKSTARAIYKRGGDSWYFITADYAGGHQVERDSTREIEALGGKVLGNSRVPTGLADLSSNLLKAQSSNAKVLGVANFGHDAITTIRQAQEFGLKQTLAGILLFITDIHGAGLDATKDLRLTNSFYWDRNDVSRAWSKRFFDKHKKMPTMDQAGTYSAVLSYLKAVKATGNKNAKDVMAALRKTEISDAFVEKGRLREDGLFMHDYYLWRVKKPSESRYPWDYYELQETVSAEDAAFPASESKCKLLQK